MTDTHLTFLLHPDLADRPESQPALLRDQAVERLRDSIVSGRLPPGAKLVERTVAEWLGVSRIPARDALRQLEQEGLVESRSTGRHVIEFDESVIRELYEVRHALERVAVRLAAQNTCPENRAALAHCLESLREAVAGRDRSGHVAADVEMHWLIWRQARNQRLFYMLNSMVGPIVMFVANNVDATDWDDTFAQHEALVMAINAGDVAASLHSLDLHMESALRHSLQGFRGSETRA